MSDLTCRDRVRCLLAFQGRARVLHLTWVAFFLTFVVWFNFAPFAATIGEQLGLSRTQLGTLALANVALTVPARVLVGMALDRWGPRRTFGALLVFASVPCTAFALATTFEVLLVSRLALSVVGAGFVVGIRMVSEWFPPREVGMAEGVYGGWGNVGSAAAALTLPAVAAMVGGPSGWRIATAMTGVMALGYGLFYLRAVADTPDGHTHVRPGRHDAGDQYPFRAVAILCLVYAVTFGSEVAVVSMLPTFFADTFGLGAVAAGATGSAYAFMNLASRPVGGLCSDVLGSRRRTLLVLLVAMAGGYALLAGIGPGWPLAVAVAAVMLCAFCEQAGAGATYAIAPLVKRRVSGQISGLVGASGSAGGLLSLTLLTLTGPTALFAVIAVSAVVAAVACRWLPEPEGSFAAAHAPDDSRMARQS